MARTGKIARLPFALREALNQRLLDNQGAGEILPWLNAKAGLTDGSEITPQNLSEWRAGGFSEWLEKREKVEKTKALADYCLRMAEAGGGALDLPAAVAGGQLMEALEAFEPALLKDLLDEKPHKWFDLVRSLAALQSSKAANAKTALDERKLDQAERKLALDQAAFEVKTCEAFIKWFKVERAREIASDKALAPAVQVAQLRQLMFGEVTHGED